MFKGYLPMDGKRALEKYKNRTEFYSYEWVQKKFADFGGVLKDDIVQIDIDNEKDSEIIYQIIKDKNIQCNILDTDRGKHFYFINNGINTRKQANYNALGIPMDIGLGVQNAVVPLRINNKTRRLIKSAVMEELPKWLYPLGRDQITNFQDMQEGDGRNQALFNYILKLQSEGFNKDEIKETIKIINKYVLKEPLAERELEVILRDEAFLRKSFYLHKKFLHDKFADFLQKEEKIIKINELLHIYKEGIYTSNIVEIEKAMIKHIPGLTRAKRYEVLLYLELIAEEKKLSDVDYIVLENGLYSLRDDKLMNFNPNYVAKNKISIKYRSEAYHEITDITLNKIACNDQRLRLLIEEMIGYTLLRRNELGKSFILIGQGSNGKSTLLDLIKHFLGEDNISSISLEELGQRFKTAELYGKLANIGDDISANYMENNAVFKKLVTGETVNVERKGRDPFDFNNYSKLIFSANEMPRINDTSEGLMRRLIIIPFRARFSKYSADYDPFIKDKLMTDEAMEYLLNISIKGLKRVIKNRGFTEVESVETEIKEYEKRNNPVMAYLEEFNIENKPTKDVYLSYSVWCRENGLKPLSRIQFSREVCKHDFKTKQKRVNNKRIQVFVKDKSKIQ